MHVEDRVGCWVPVLIMLHFTKAGFLAKSRTCQLGWSISSTCPGSFPVSAFYVLGLQAGTMTA